MKTIWISLSLLILSFIFSASSSLQAAYDPNRGQWITRDPIAENGGINLYSYTANNPINGIDPFGLKVYSPDFVGPLQPGDSYGDPAATDWLSQLQQWIDNIEGNSNTQATQLASSLASLRGFPGDRNWNNLLNQMRKNGRGDICIKETGVPTQSQAETLIQQAKGTIKRIETGQPNSVHNYPHINFEGPDGSMKQFKFKKLQIQCQVNSKFINM